MSEGVLVEVVVPQLGEAVSEVRIVEWVKNTGEAVATGDVLFIVDTEKAEVDVEAFVGGVLVEIIVTDDRVTKPGTVVGHILAPADAGNSAAPQVDVSADLPSPSVEPAASSPASSEPGTPAWTTGASEVAATPKARRLARQLGVDVEDAVPSRRDAVVSEADVSLLAAASDPGPGASHLAQRIGNAMAARMTESKQTVPHFYLTADVDMSKVLSIRENIGVSGRDLPSLTSFVILAVVRALGAHPHLISAGEVGSTGIGVAVATEAGLVVPTVATADMPDLWVVDERLAGAAERARNLKLQPTDLTPRRVTVSNLGMFGIDSFYGIIDPPDNMLITVGATKERVVAQNNEISVRPMAAFGMSADHRKMDGASAATFLTDLRATLESIDGIIAVPEAK